MRALTPATSEALPLVPPHRSRADCQALLATGMPGLRRAEYWLLRIDDAARARAWLAMLLRSGRVHSAQRIGGASDPVRESVSVAVSHAGLRALGVQEHAQYPFPQAFRDGMASPARASRLGDDDADRWDWGDVASSRGHVAHLWVGVFGEVGAAPSVARPGAQEGVHAHVVTTCPAYLQPDGRGGIKGYEPFGFRDGIAQPWVPELLDAQSRRVRARQQRSHPYLDDHRVAMGEFVLGQLNAYGEPSHCPDVVGWPHAGSAASPRFASNASYLAVRQIEQDVAAFAALDPDDAARMIGRCRDDEGTPLVPRPAQDAGEDVDAFRYRTQDPVGFACPRGAHIRRANPRDSLGHDAEAGLELARLHRVMRRGRTYRRDSPCCPSPGCGDCGADRYRRSDCGAGLMFVACNADLERQFEFIMQRWLLNPRFNDLVDEDDPLLGRRGRFSMPHPDPSGSRLDGLPRLTRTLGGGYFLLPGLAALHVLAGLEQPAAGT